MKCVFEMCTQYHHMGETIPLYTAVQQMDETSWRVMTEQYS